MVLFSSFHFTSSLQKSLYNCINWTSFIKLVECPPFYPGVKILPQVLISSSHISISPTSQFLTQHSKTACGLMWVTAINRWPRVNSLPAPWPLRSSVLLIASLALSWCSLSHYPRNRKRNMWKEANCTISIQKWRAVIFCSCMLSCRITAFHFVH